MASSAPPGSRILVVDDDEVTLDFVELGLQYEGFEVARAADGHDALRLIERQRMDLIVLDLNLPSLDGVEVCHRIRQRDDTPIIMLTARADVDERVAGLEAGADDYLPKPFKFKELLARIRAVMRRRTAPDRSILRHGPLVLNRDTREVELDGKTIVLTTRELDLLETLMLHPRTVLRRAALLNRVWGTDHLGDGNLIEAHISALRQKLDDRERRLIRTVRGVGYALG